MTPEERDQAALRDPEEIAEEIVSKHGPFSMMTRAGLLDDIQLALGRRDYALRNAVESTEPLEAWRQRMRDQRRRAGGP